MLGIELPAEQGLQRIVRTALHGFFHDLYARVTAQLSETTRANLDQLLVVAPGASQSTFDQLKADPSAPGVKNLQKEVTTLQTLRALGISAEGSVAKNIWSLYSPLTALCSCRQPKQPSHDPVLRQDISL
jgi:hypothetical protein